MQSSTSMSESAYIDIEQDALQTLLNKLNGFVPIFFRSLFPFVIGRLSDRGFIRGGASNTNLKALRVIH